MAVLTPMMQQYFDIKESYKDCILFFRLGDFYEMFYKDAEIASRELEITLTGRDCGQEERAPMCGVPFHSADSYIARLINKGYKVAICEQVEDPSLAKGIVKRDVIRVVTPGTVTDSSMLDDKKNNFLMSIYKSRNCFGLAVVDVSTGEFSAAQILFGNTVQKLIDEIGRFSPSEMIVNSELYNDSKLMSFVRSRFNAYISVFDDIYFKKGTAVEKLSRKFEDIDFSSNQPDLSINASGALLEYLDNTQKVNLNHIRKFETYKIEEYMVLDIIARKNLELTESMKDKSKKGTLLWVLDRTVTSMGGRTLRKWIEQPLVNIHDINARLYGVKEIREKFINRMEIRELLKRVYDIERLMGKVVLGNANGRDLISLKNSLGQVPYIKEVLENFDSDLCRDAFEKMDTLEDVYGLIERALVEDPPVTIKEGSIIKTGYNEEVDRYRKASNDGKSWIAALESSEREKTGIRNLKVGFNKVFGYFIEVTKSYYQLVPESYIRKQTLANCERYITQELKELEESILGAEDKLMGLEFRLFTELRDIVASNVGRIKQTASGIAELDVLCSLAEVAERENYCMPEMTEGDLIDLIEGRHPVVEKMSGDNSFVSNDTLLDGNENRLLIITGPNMAGKSTYMRQVALITLMAQIGSFVPAAKAEIGITDRIFTRVGAQDDIFAGQSTFMVEMSEVANILENATPKSLLILDEVGRGTSTFDGLSIAWAVIEYINDIKRLGARTLFATHYHELTELEGKHEGIKNYCISVKRESDDIIFLRKIIRGGADESYGIEVAKLAGVPQNVTDRAKEILKELEDADINKKLSRINKGRKPISGQLDFYAFAGDAKEKDEFLERVKGIDVTALTPIDALNMLYELQQGAKKLV